MSRLEGWQSSPLPALLHKMKAGGTPNTSRDEYYEGGTPFVTIEDMSTSKKRLAKTVKNLSDSGLENSSAWLIPPNSILYSIYATLGLPRINAIPVATNQAILALVPDPAAVNLDYLYYWLDYIRPTVVNLSAQTTQSNLSATSVRKFVVDHPSSLIEQNKIAELLSTVDEAIEQTEALIVKQQHIQTGLMHDLLTRGIDEQGTLRTEGTHAFKDSPIGRIPVEWNVADLKSVGDWFSGGAPSKADGAYWDGEIPWVTPKDMKQLDLKETTDKLTPLGVRFGSKVMPQNTVFIVVRGMILAHTCPVCVAVRPMAFNQDVKAIVAKSGIVGRFIAYWFVTYSHLMLKLTTSATHGTKRFDMHDIFGVPIALPDECEQIRIVEILDKSQQSISGHAAEIKKLKFLKTSLMQDLLSGRRRVTTLLSDAEATHA